MHLITNAYCNMYLEIVISRYLNKLEEPINNMQINIIADVEKKNAYKLFVQKGNGVLRCAYNLIL